MSNSKSKSEPGSAKKHGNTAMQENDLHTLGPQRASPVIDAVPAAETGGHSHSSAAHLEGKGSEHTKPGRKFAARVSSRRASGTAHGGPAGWKAASRMI